MEMRERIVEFVKQKGPTLPVHIGKEMGMNIIMSAAHLAELTASGRLKISNIKVGGSPLYYFPGHEEMLQKFAVNLNEKDKRAFDALNEKKVLKDSEQTPLMRVSLREIKDFALPINVTYDNKKEMFWKWHMTSDEDAEKLIKSGMNIKEEEKEAPKVELEEAKKLEEKKPEKEQEKQKTLKPKEKKPKKEKSSFMSDVLKFFEKNNINVLSTDVVKKNSEIDFMIEIPSIMGNLQYYCKAKDKKTITENDLSNTYVKAQFKKMPVILISAGELTQKAQEMLKNELKGLSFKKL